MSNPVETETTEQAQPSSEHELQYHVEFRSSYGSDLTAWYDTTITVPVGTTEETIKERVRERIVSQVADRSPEDLELAFSECTGVRLLDPDATLLPGNDDILEFTTRVAYETDGVQCKGHAFAADVQDGIVYLQILAYEIDGADPTEKTIHEVPITDVTRSLEDQENA